FLVKDLRRELADGRVQPPGLGKEEPSVVGHRLVALKEVFQRRDVTALWMASLDRLLELLGIAEKHQTHRPVQPRARWRATSGLPRRPPTHRERPRSRVAPTPRRFLQRRRHRRSRLRSTGHGSSWSRPDHRADSRSSRAPYGCNEARSLPPLRLRA